MQLYKKLKQFKDLVIAQHDGISHLKDMCNIKKSCYAIRSFETVRKC